MYNSFLFLQELTWIPLKKILKLKGQVKPKFSTKKTTDSTRYKKVIKIKSFELNEITDFLLEWIQRTLNVKSYFKIQPQKFKLRPFRVKISLCVEVVALWTRGVDLVTDAIIFSISIEDERDERVPGFTWWRKEYVN